MSSTNNAIVQWEVKCTACGCLNLVDFDAPNVETDDNDKGVFYLTCTWGKCNHRGKYRFKGDLIGERVQKP